MTKLRFKHYIKQLDDKMLSKTRKRLNAKSPKKRMFGEIEEGQGELDISEDTLQEFLSGIVRHGEEEQETTTTGNKIDLARQLFQTLINRPDMNRQSIIQHFVDRVGVTHSTAVSYYERLAKEAGLTRTDDKEDLGQSIDMTAGTKTPPSTAPIKELPADTHAELTDEIGEPSNEERTGVIRTVKDAHLIYKKRSEDGTFEELWIYNVSDNMRDELKIRRDILAGTDIPKHKTKSPDGSQSYSISTVGNAQYVHIKGLPN